MPCRRFRLPVLLAPAVMGVVLPSPVVTAEPPRDTWSDTWVATDGLGRTLPGFAECGPPRAGKSVAIFYFLWLDPGVARAQGGPFDLSKLIAADPARPAYGPPGSFHYWGEPRFGYYLSDDPFVLRKHAQMLTDAGVDALAFDVTNGPTYDGSALALMRTFEQVRADGGVVPRFFYLANSGSARVVAHVYERVYAKNLHPDLWFRWKGRPLLLAPDEGLSPEVRGFFTLRRSWAWSDPKGWFGDGRDRWTWVDHYPQKPGWHDAPSKPEQVSVSVAQHPVSNIGRSFHNGRQPPPGAVDTGRGLCFAEQWRRAREVDPELVFVTGWNEWVAQRFIAERAGESFIGRRLEKGETLFVDQYSPEFSRDIEPVRGGHADHYYYQLVANVRRFKGVRPRPKASAPRTIRIDGGFARWGDVGPAFLDDLGDTAHRDHPGWGREGQIRYVNTSGRNDLDLCKVARDASSLFFYARTRAPLSPRGGPGWMWLLLDTDGDHRTGWEGYDVIVNRKGPGVVERHRGSGWSWEAVGEAPLAVEGRELQLALPRALVGLDASRGPLRVDFKWVDHAPESGDILDFLDQGDAAPNARFNYRYEE